MTHIGREEDMSGDSGKGMGVPASPSGHSPSGLSQSALSQAQPSVSNAGAIWNPRSMAPKDRRILVLCDDRAPYPVMIGMWDGERYVSKDKGTDGKTWNVLGWLPLPEPGPILVYPPTCSFCGKDSEEVEKLIAGPAVMICTECVKLCSDLASAGEAGTATPPAASGPKASTRPPKAGTPKTQPKEVRNDQ